MLKSYTLGNPVNTVEMWDVATRRPTSGWVWSDDGSPTWFCWNRKMNWQGRRCPKCRLSATPEGHDPCIANLPGVDYACCGHGVEKGYVKFSNGLVLRGRFDHV